MDAIPGRKWRILGNCQQDGQHDLLQQRERHGGGKGHDDGQHDLLLQREWYGCGNCDYGRTLMRS